jgi:hypothetical protein
MNSEELIARFQKQGFDMLSTAECLQYLNDAYLLDICEDEDWFFLEASATGTAPLEIPDLRTIEYVIDTTQETRLEPLRRARIADSNTNLAEAGPPLYYYVTEGTTVNTFPTSSTDELLVRYWKVPDELTGSVTPILPTRWHSLIVDGARARAYTNADDWELRTAAQNDFEAKLERMRESLDSQQHDAPDDYVVVTDPYANFG